MSKQIQKSGDNSTQVQAENYYAGATPAEVIQIFNTLWENNFPKLQKQAMDIADQRASELKNEIIQELSTKAPEIIENLSTPRKQNDLFEAQKGYALSGSEALRKTLTSLVCASLEEKDESSSNSIILSEAIKVAKNLSSNHLKILGCIYLLKQLRFAPRNVQHLLDLFQQHLLAIDINEINFNVSEFLNLEFHRCVIIAPLQKKVFVPLMRETYPGIFSKGFTIEHIENILGSMSFLPKNLIVENLHDPKLLQIGIANEEDLKTFKLEQRLHDKVVKTLRDNRMGDDEITHLIKNKSENFDLFIKNWDASAISACRLSPVGKTLGHTFLQTRIDLPNL